MVIVRHKSKKGYITEFLKNKLTISNKLLVSSLQVVCYDRWLVNLKPAINVDMVI